MLAGAPGDDLAQGLADQGVAVILDGPDDLVAAGVGGGLAKNHPAHAAGRAKHHNRGYQTHRLLPPGALSGEGSGAPKIHHRRSASRGLVTVELPRSYKRRRNATLLRRGKCSHGVFYPQIASIFTLPTTTSSLTCHLCQRPQIEYPRRRPRLGALMFHILPLGGDHRPRPLIPARRFPAQVKSCLAKPTKPGSFPVIFPPRSFTLTPAPPLKLAR